MSTRLSGTLWKYYDRGWCGRGWSWHHERFRPRRSPCCPYLSFPVLACCSPVPSCSSPLSTCSSFESAATTSVLTFSPHSPILELPSFQPICDASFSWGELDGPECITTIDRCYEAVHWIWNLFMVPPGNAFIKELSQLFWAYANNSALEPVALFFRNLIENLRWKNTLYY